jgi:TonB family protein
MSTPPLASRKVMDDKTALHTAARRHCQERFSEWIKTYTDLQTGEEWQVENLFKPGWDYSRQAYRVFLRYRIDQAIQVEVQRLAPEASPSFEALRSRYPPLARQARLTGTVVIKLTIAADGTVLKTESSVEAKNTTGFDLPKDDAERIVKPWTFGCAGCSPHAPFEHTIKFIYKQEDSFTTPSLHVVLNLPDEVTISTDAVVVQPSNNSKKGSH